MTCCAGHVEVPGQRVCQKVADCDTETLCPANSQCVSEGECLCPPTSCWSQGGCVPICRLGTVFDYNVTSKSKSGSPESGVVKKFRLIVGPAIFSASPMDFTSSTKHDILSSSTPSAVLYAEPADSGGNFQNVMIFVGVAVLLVATVGLLGVFWILRHRLRKEHTTGREYFLDTETTTVLRYTF